MNQPAQQFGPNQDPQAELERLRGARSFTVHSGIARLGKKSGPRRKKLDEGGDEEAKRKKKLLLIFLVLAAVYIYMQYF